MLPILKAKFSGTDIVKTIFQKEKFVEKISILEDCLLISDIGNSRVIENAFPEKSHDL